MNHSAVVVSSLILAACGNQAAIELGRTSGSFEALETNLPTLDSQEPANDSGADTPGSTDAGLSESHRDDDDHIGNPGPPPPESRGAPPPGPALYLYCDSASECPSDATICKNNRCVECINAVQCAALYGPSRGTCLDGLCRECFADFDCYPWAGGGIDDGFGRCNPETRTCEVTSCDDRGRCSPALTCVEETWCVLECGDENQCMGDNVCEDGHCTSPSFPTAP